MYCLGRTARRWDWSGLKGTQRHLRGLPFCWRKASPGAWRACLKDPKATVQQAAPRTGLGYSAASTGRHNVGGFRLLERKERLCVRIALHYPYVMVKASRCVPCVPHVLRPHMSHQGCWVTVASEYLTGGGYCAGTCIVVDVQPDRVDRNQDLPLGVITALAATARSCSRPVAPASAAAPCATHGSLYCGCGCRDGATIRATSLQLLTTWLRPDSSFTAAAEPRCWCTSCTAAF